jgi:hypothetical protein
VLKRIPIATYSVTRLTATQATTRVAATAHEKRAGSVLRAIQWQATAQTTTHPIAPGNPCATPTNAPTSVPGNSSKACPTVLLKREQKAQNWRTGQPYTANAAARTLAHIQASNIQRGTPRRWSGLTDPDLSGILCFLK